MQFLRTVFWVVIFVVGVLFAVANGQVVQVHLWGDLIADMPLWLVVMIAFLIGLLPVLILHRATRWSLKRKLDAANRTLTESLAAAPEPPRMDITAVHPPGAL